MAHVAKILPGMTFRLQLAVVAPYNADFDGDEMISPLCFLRAFVVYTLCVHTSCVHTL